MLTNPVCLQHDQFVQNVPSHFRLNENLKNTKKGPELVHGSQVGEGERGIYEQHWITAQWKYWQRFSRHTLNFQSLPFTARTNILSMSMNSFGHKYIIRRQETGCENYLPACLQKHNHVVAAEKNFFWIVPIWGVELNMARGKREIH